MSDEYEESQNSQLYTSQHKDSSQREPSQRVYSRRESLQKDLQYIKKLNSSQMDHKQGSILQRDSKQIDQSHRDQYHNDLQYKDIHEKDNNKPQFTESPYSTFARLYTTHVALFKKKSNLENQLKEKLKTQNILKQCILEKEASNLKKQKPISKDMVQEKFTFSLSKSSDTFFELVEIGQLPASNFEKYHTREYIYPIGYISKRFYANNKSFTTSNNPTTSPTDNEFTNSSPTKICYTCKILENCFLIESEDGQIWKGLDMWTSFVGNFDSSFEFKTFEHFFGLNYKNIQSQIEKMGDISVFANYVPLDERNNK